MCGFLVHNLNKCQVSIDNLSFSARGPDALEVKSVDGLSFWHSRLEITGADEGRQPLSNHRFVMVYNGEVYNSHELCMRHNLKASNSDTKNIFYLITETGCSIASQFIGFFSIILYDRHLRTIHLMRDHFGIKPLYFFRNNDSFIAGSSVRDIRNLAYNSEEVFQSNWSSHVLGFELPDCGDRAVRALDPGQVISFVLEPGFQYLSHRWLDLRPFSSSSKVNDLKSLIERAVQRNTPRDVDYAVWLSGGIDSCLLAQFFARSRVRKPKCFISVLGPRNHEDVERASRVAHLLNLPHVVVPFRKLSHKTHVFELDTFDGDNWVNACSGTVSNGCKVAVAGAGADEIFLGYGHYHLLYKFRKLGWLTDFFGIYKRVIGSRTWVHRFILAHRVKKRLRRNIKYDGSRVSWFDFTHYLPYQLLRDIDNAAGYFGIEVRVPYLDQELVNWAFLNKAFKKPDFKKDLYDLIDEELRNEIFSIKKSGFTP